MGEESFLHGTASTILYQFLFCIPSSVGGILRASGAVHRGSSFALQMPLTNCHQNPIGNRKLSGSFFSSFLNIMQCSAQGRPVHNPHGLSLRARCTQQSIQLLSCGCSNFTLWIHSRGCHRSYSCFSNLYDLFFLS